MKRKFQILSIDGGGLKGLFPAGILAHWEMTYGVKIVDHFDLIVGTSTGGIIALGLGKGMSPQEISGFYLERGPTIFEGADGLLKQALHLAKPKFDSSSLGMELKLCFGDTLLGESEKRLVITAYDMENDDVRLFKTAHEKRLRNDFNIPMWQVALATASAPTYFSACTEIANTRLVDGGVWANNPTMVGLTEALSLGVPPEGINILSIGTSWDLKNRSDNLDSGGKWDWKAEAVDVMFRGQSHAALKQAELILRPFGKDRILRIDFSVPEDTFAMDSVDPTRILRKVEYIARHEGPAFEERFLQHKADIFQPIYSVQKEVTNAS